MTVVTPAQVEKRLIDLGNEYDEAHKALENSEMKYASAKTLWEVNSARCRLGIRAKALESGRKMTVQEIDDEAVVRCQDELLALNTAEAIVRSARANSNRIRTQIDIARSVGTSVRAAMDLT